LVGELRSYMLQGVARKLINILKIKMRTTEPQYMYICLLVYSICAYMTILKLILSYHTRLSISILDYKLLDAK